MREDLAPDDDGLRGSAERARVREVKVTLRRVDVRDREWAHALGTVVRLPAWPALAHVEPAALAVAAAARRGDAAAGARLALARGAVVARRAEALTEAAQAVVVAVVRTRLDSAARLALRVGVEVGRDN